jgi:steroid delta-isomerase-like uncharacterized protein
MADRASAERIVRAYYDAFNACDVPGFLALLTEDVVHDISQGGRETGREAFAQFLAHMDRCYEERITDLVVMTDESGTRAAAEFVVHGKYLQSDPGVPAGTRPASGQSYVLPAGAFFTLCDGQVARISNHYNLGDWIAQVNRA